jgi:hypothetical protein
MPTIESLNKIDIKPDRYTFSDKKTESIWGKPNRSYYKFLERLKKSNLPKTICILGCSDGKFVIPAAMKGFSVLAIDIDSAAIFGGEMNIFGKTITNIGMVKRLEIRKLTDRVDVVNQSFVDYVPTKTYSGVFTSGSIQYSENSSIELKEIINKIQNYVSPNGFLFQEYIHVSEYDNDPNRHFLDKKTMAFFFDNPQWTIINHRKKQYTESPNPRINREHIVVWGSILAQKNY